MWSVCDNWEYHKKFRDNEPQDTSTSLHDTTRAVIPTVRTRETIATFRPIFPRLYTKPYNESSTACKLSSRSEYWVLGHVNHFCYWGQGQIYYFPPPPPELIPRKYELQSSFTFSSTRLSMKRMYFKQVVALLHKEEKEESGRMTDKEIKII